MPNLNQFPWVALPGPKTVPIHFCSKIINFHSANHTFLRSHRSGDANPELLVTHWTRKSSYACVWLFSILFAIILRSNSLQMTSIVLKIHILFFRGSRDQDSPLLFTPVARQFLCACVWFFSDFSGTILCVKPDRSVWSHFQTIIWRW